jgi:hypothetical protein
MKRKKNIKETLDTFTRKIKTASLYDWYAYDQTAEDIKIKKLIEYAKITEFKK